MKLKNIAHDLKKPWATKSKTTGNVFRRYGQRFINAPDPLKAHPLLLSTGYPLP